MSARKFLARKLCQPGKTSMSHRCHFASLVKIRCHRCVPLPDSKMDPAVTQKFLATTTSLLQTQMAFQATQMASQVTELASLRAGNICDQEDTENPMVQCDQCNKWFHHSCLNITEELAKRASMVFCHKCRGCMCTRKVCGKDLSDGELILVGCRCKLGPQVIFEESTS